MRVVHRTLVAVSLLALILFPCIPALGQNPSMQLITAKSGWAIDNHRLFWTSDNGSHWKDVTPAHGPSENLTDVFFSDESHGWALLYAEDDDQGKLTFRVAGTADSGQTWTVALVKIPSQKPDELSGYGWLDFIDPLCGWMVLQAKSSSAFSWGLLLATSDGGKSWNELPQAPMAGRPVFATPRDGWVAGNAGGGGIYSTHDGGRTWQGDGPPLENLPQSLPTRATYGDAKFTDARHGFLPIWLRPSSDAEEPRGTALVLYVTDDGGRSWKLDRTLTDQGASTKKKRVQRYRALARALWCHTPRELNRLSSWLSMTGNT